MFKFKTNKKKVFVCIETKLKLNQKHARTTGSDITQTNQKCKLCRDFSIMSLFSGTNTRCVWSEELKEKV